MRLRSIVIVAFVGGVALFGACFHSLYNDPDACSLDPPVTCADPARPNCVLGHCFSDTDLPDGAVPIDFSGITTDAALPCNGSNECPEEAPVCQAGKCRGCMTNTDDVQCAIHDPGAPRCNTANGRCVQCLLSGDCGASTPVCGADQTCRKCAAHTECATTHVCKTDGTCATPGEVAVVDNTKVSCGPAGMPYCDIQTAANAGKPYVTVAGSPTKYAAVSLGGATSATVTIVGPGRDAMPPAFVDGTSSSSSAVSVSSTLVTVTATVTIDGMKLTGSNGGTKRAGVVCSVISGQASVTVKNSRIQDSGGYGIDISGCTVVADANLIGPSNNGGGISVAQAPSMFTITNNIVFQNGTGGRGVTMDDASTGTFAFNTVVKNNYANGMGGIECGQGALKPIIGSIVVLNTGLTAGQVGAACSLTASVTATTPTFVGTSDYHLVKNDPTNVACCVDKITPTAGAAVDHDVDIGHRPQGQSWDVGAHEVQ